MNPISAAADLSRELPHDEQQAAEEIRQLKELEMVLVGGGGEAIPLW